MQTVTYIEMDDSEFNDLVEKHYGVEFEIVAAEEWSNDESHTFNVKKGEDSNFTEYDKHSWDNFLIGKEYMYMGYTIFQHLVNDGHLPEGSYLIKLSW